MLGCLHTFYFTLYLFLVNSIHVQCFHFQTPPHDFRYISQAQISSLIFSFIYIYFYLSDTSLEYLSKVLQTQPSLNWTHNQNSKLHPFLWLPLVIKCTFTEFSISVDTAVPNAAAQALDVSGYFWHQVLLHQPCANKHMSPANCTYTQLSNLSKCLHLWCHNPGIWFKCLEFFFLCGFCLFVLLCFLFFFLNIYTAATVIITKCISGQVICLL